MTAGPAGPPLFARYAFPPNVLGYCGPPDSSVFGAYARTGVADDDLPRLARSFVGAWAYLELIARAAGIPDPLDRRVVEAYWIGNRLLDGARLAGLAESSAGRLALRGAVVEREALDRGVPHHSFHVLFGYPWARLLHDPRMAGRALTVLDQCLIRWGEVTAVTGDGVLVESRPLAWDGRRLTLGRPVTRPTGTDVAAAAGLSVGDVVSLHWDRVCDRLSRGQARALAAYTRRHLDLVNADAGRSSGSAAPDGR